MRRLCQSFLQEGVFDVKPSPVIVSPIHIGYERIFATAFRKRLFHD